MRGFQDASQRSSSKVSRDFDSCFDNIAKLLLDCETTTCLPATLNTVLELLGNALNAGQLHLAGAAHTHNDETYLRMIACWPNDNPEETPADLTAGKTPFVLPSDWLEKLTAGEVLHNHAMSRNSASELAPDEKPELARIMIPLMSGSRLQGVLQAFRSKSRRAWTPNETNLLRQAGSLIQLKLQSWQPPSESERSHPRSRSMFELAPQAYHTLDADGSILEVNEAWLNQVGYPREEVIGTWFGSFLHPSQQEGFKQEFQQFINQGGQRRTESRVLRKDGSYFDACFTCQLTLDPHTQEQRAYCTFLDITELKIANETLAHSELIKSLVLDSIDELVVYEDIHQNIIWANQAAQEHAGRATQELIGHPCFQMLYGRKDHCPGCPILKVHATRQPQRNEVQAPDGSWWEVIGTPVFDPLNGRELSGVVKLARDVTHRKLALRSLEENEERYRAVVEDQAEFICRFSPDGRLTFVNAAISRLFEVKQVNAVGNHLSDYLTPDELRRFTIRLERITPRHPIQTFRVHSITPQGRDYWGDWTIRAIYDSEDFLVEYQAVGRDVTAEQVARLQLAESQASLAEAQAIAHVGSWRWDLRSDEVQWSEEYWRIFGLEPKHEPQPRGYFREYIHPDDLPRLRAANADALLGRKPYDINYRIYRKDGALRHIRSQGLVRRDPNGKPIRFNGIIHDVTELRATQQALFQSESRLKAMVEAVPDLMFLLDRDGRYLECYSRSPELMWIPPSELLGRTLADVMPKSVAHAGHAALAEALATGEVTTLEYSLELPTGLHWFEARLSKCGDDEALAIVRDITEQVNAINTQHELELRYRDLFNQLLDPVYVHYCLLTENRESYFIEANRAATELLGYTAEEFRQLSPAEFDAGPEDADLKPVLERLMAGKTVVFERLHRAKSGEVIPVEIHARPIEYQGEQAVVSVVRDLRPVLEATEELRGNEQRFRTMFDRHTLPMMLVEPDTGQIIDANAAAQGFYGYTREQFQLMDIADINMLPPDEIAVALKKVSAKECSRFVFPHRLADGDVRTVEVNTAPIEVEGHSLLFSIIHDTTEQERAIELLITSEARFRSLLQIAPVAIGLVVDRVIRWNNELMQQILGYHAGELDGQSARILYPSQAEFERVGREYMCQIRHRGHGTVETTWIRRDGQQASVLLSAALLDPHDESQGVIFTALDITQSKQDAQERDNLIMDLSKSLTEIRTLSGLLPICANCKKIRTDSGYWQQIEGYIQQHSAAQFSHSICPECAEKLYPGINLEG